MNWRDYITTDPQICHGKPCVQGTRVLVAVILDCLAADQSIDEVLVEYPSLTRQAVLATLAYSSELAQGRIVAA